MPLLVIERGENKGTSVRVEPGKAFVVGRENPGSCIAMKDPMASRNHFEVRAEGDGWVIRDLKSRNGTTLNDERLTPDQPTPLRIGDKIQVGETILSFLSDEKEETSGGLVGKVIGGYRLQERLGRGGMGTVYKAEQLSLHRVVALKVLSAKLMQDATFVEKFVSEARAAGQLNHPNIVQVFDVGSDRGVHFFSMELMSQESVGDIVSRQGPVPWERALEMMMDAAAGLIFAEKKGIVHRDIKPDNLMLTPEGTVKIGDLGLAKQGGESAPGEGGAIFGTPHFIAPEQAQGKPVDNRADLYSLGATFYRILTGRTPFSGENVKEILLKQIHDEPTPLQKLVPDVPQEMALVIGKLMKKKPDDRYRSAQGLLEDLERIRIAYHVETHAATAAARRNRILAGVLGVAVLALGGVAWHFMNKPAEKEIVTQIVDSGNGRTQGPTLEELEQQRQNNARAALLELKLEDAEFSNRKAGGSDPFQSGSWKTLEREWLALAGKFEEMAAAHKGTEAAQEAQSRARTIRDRLKEAAEDDLRRREAASDAAAAMLEKIRGLRAGGDVNAALGLARGAMASLRPEHGERLPAELEADLEKERRAVVDAAEASASAAAAAVRTALRTYPPAGLDAALQGMDAAFGPMMPVGDGAQDAELAEIVRRTRSEVGAAVVEARGRALAALEADNALYVKTYAGIRAWAPTGTAPETPGTPFFDYRWDEAIAAWEAAATGMKTAEFLRRTQAKIDHYRLCKTVFEALAAKLASRDHGFPQPFKGTNLYLDRAPGSEPPSITGVSILRQVGGTRVKGWLEYREMTPADLYGNFLNRGAVDLGGGAAGHLALAVFLAEAGEGEMAVEQLGAAAAAGADMEGEFRALREWLNAELMAYSDWKPVLDAVAAYDRSREQGASPAVVATQRSRVEKLAAGFGRSESVRCSDYFLLHVLAEGDGTRHLAYPAAWKDAVLAPFGALPGHLNGGGDPGDDGSKDTPPGEGEPQDGDVKDGDGSKKEADGGADEERGRTPAEDR